MKTLFTWMSVAAVLYTSLPALADTHRASPPHGNTGIVDRATQERAEREQHEREARDRREREARERAERERQERARREREAQARAERERQEREAHERREHGRWQNSEGPHRASAVDVR